MSSRRDFLCQLGVGAAGALLPMRSLRTADSKLPAVDAIQFGYAAITWGGDDERAIEDISALGFPGIQLRANVLTRYGLRPAVLREQLAAHRLTFVALSSGNVSIDPSAESRVIEEHVSHARFLRDAGGLYLQLIDERPSGHEIVSADTERLGRLLTEIGEKPNEIDRILDASDPKYVGLLLDVAHYQVGGGDPVAAVRRHAERLLFLHIKDVHMSAPSVTGASYQFVELGRGSVDLPGVFAALRDVRFRGWAVVELDSVPDKTRTPKESAAISKRYLEDVIRTRVS